MTQTDCTKAIIEELNNFEVLYSAKIDLIDKQQWKKYFHHVSLITHVNSQFLFISTNRFDLGGHILPKKQKLDKLFIQNESTGATYQASVNLASRDVGLQLFGKTGSGNARWHCHFSFERNQKYHLIAQLDDATQHTIAEVQITPYFISDKSRLPKQLKHKIEAIQSSRATMRKNLAENRNYLFVIGNARSGTTALGRLLNASSEICIGIERYKKFGISANGYEKKAFFDKTSPRFKLRLKLYSTMEEKYDQARYIGDKRPGFISDWKNSLINIPAIKVIYIFRHIYGVSSSYNTRASNAAQGADSSWPPERNYIAAVDDWNIEIEQALLLAKHADVHFVKYEDIFQSKSRIYDLFSSLDVNLEEPRLQSRIENIIAKGKALESKERVLDKESLSYIDAHADFDSYRKMLELYEQQ